MMKSILISTMFLLQFTMILNAKSAGEDFIYRSSNDWESVLGLPPASGSIEEKQDVATLIRYQETRTESECFDASKEERISLMSFFGGKDGLLSDTEVKELQFFFYKHFFKSGIPSFFAKNHFDRDRPFIRFPEIKPCIGLPKGQSYPSGHAAVSRWMALVLSQKFPERTELFMKRADEIAEHRMLGGVHYPTDIVAGKTLADYLAKKHFEDETFIEELNAL